MVHVFGVLLSAHAVAEVQDSSLQDMGSLLQMNHVAQQRQIRTNEGNFVECGNPAGCEPRRVTTTPTVTTTTPPDGFEFWGDGACASSAAYRTSGEYKCLGGDRCAEGVAVVGEDGITRCAGPDGILGNDDDDYLICNEGDHDVSECAMACSKDLSCMGIELKTNTKTNKNVCELHVKVIDGLKDVSIWVKKHGKFTDEPQGRGFWRSIEDDSVAIKETSMPVQNAAECKNACLEATGCRGVEYEAPLMGVGMGDCEVHYLPFSHFATPGRCYRKLTTDTTTTTPFCLTCMEKCEAAQILDLRYMAMSNLGGLGPNVTFKGHTLPEDLKYYNVFGDPFATAQNATYLSVRALGEYKAGDVSFNGVSYEPLVDAEARAANDGSDPSPISGAYGQINMASGSSTEFEFEFQDAFGAPLIPEKVIQFTFLDIDQPQTAQTMTDDEMGGETVDICTGWNSWGITPNSKLNQTWVNNSGALCHTFKSTTKGDRSDNPWDPARSENGEVVGLSQGQLEKAFVAAFYNVSSFKVKFSVKTMQDFASRNFLFTGHKTTFCGQAEAEKVKEDYFEM